MQVAIQSSYEGDVGKRSTEGCEGCEHLWNVFFETPVNIFDTTYLPNWYGMRTHTQGLKH